MAADRDDSVQCIYMDIGSEEWEMVLHEKLQTTLWRMLQLLWCLTWATRVILCCSTICSIRSSRLTKQWSDVPNFDPADTSTMSGAPVITRSYWLPTIWVTQRTISVHIQTGSKNQENHVNTHHLARTHCSFYCCLYKCLYIKCYSRHAGFAWYNHSN